LVKEVRYGVNEYDDALASGDDVIGAYKNQFLIAQINIAIRELYALIAKRRPDAFTTEASLTAVNSVITLPSDFSKLVLLRNSDGIKVNSIEEVQRRRTADQGHAYVYYKRGSTLVIDHLSDTGTYGLVYKKKPRDIHQGRFAVTAEIVEPPTPAVYHLDPKDSKTTVDFYNGMLLENITAEWDTLITDYAANRVVTFATGFEPTDGDFYGLVPEIPEWAHHLIAPRATIFAKLNPISKEKPKRDELDAYKDMLISAFREHAGPEEDQDYEELFFHPEAKSYGALLI